MKIIINTTNLKIGGALQVAISFIYECTSFTENEYHIFLSPSMRKEIEQNKFPENFKFYSFDNPSRFIVFDKTIKLLNKMEEKIKPDCVFSVFGPTYWKPKSKHIMGFANGLYLYGDLPYMQNMGALEKLKFNLKKTYHQFLLKNNADLYVVQTEDMKDRFSKFINKPKEKIRVVSSKYHSIFEQEINDLNLLPKKEADEFWFVTISAYYPHKKLDIINDLVKIIKEKNLNVKFILTLPENVLESKFQKSKEYIINLGPVKLEECPYIYSMSDALFLPTLVESFTASYPEAMVMKKPILTSHYSFATSVCKDGALYFNPYDVNDIINQITKIYYDKELYQAMVSKALLIIEELPSSKERAEEYLKLCKEVIQDV
ncbi:glycosyltransferase [Candidatus Sulfurimonas marisnigri]|uniref:Glycosyltransferase n=1 Tax=Candidatus Sulfurimonas marisnigri TaxID=2740405 RepID=A0A7S7M023_9BACT|nr:glycosyltransferase [Candidatus Sulfurimonas marisnigri]QOY54063.1 glycosyltransferase [Candidatus Sulfurimonas marisnigri]